MLKSFEISGVQNGKYKNNFDLNESIKFSYEHDEIFTRVKLGDDAIICYGYCFDVRDPELETKKTLESLLKNVENLKYLNGHFILLFNIDGKISLLTDAVGITPVYIDSSNKVVTTEETGDLPTLNGLSRLNLTDYTIERISLATNKLTNERIERLILDLVAPQYKYFSDKSLTLNFRRNQLNKALFSILRFSLPNQDLNLREKDSLTKKVSKWLAREYQMNILNDEVEPSTQFLVNAHLMDYKNYMKNNYEIKDNNLQEFKDLYNIDIQYSKEQMYIEKNLFERLRYRSENKPQLIFDPFNVIAIQELVYRFDSKEKFDPLSRIIKILNPSIDFYDFAKGETLMQKYNKLKLKNQKLSKENENIMINQDFLNETRKKGIYVSDNLDGTVEDKSVTIYPVSEKISKDDKYELTYFKEGPGMMLIESYFDNPKNARRIKVELNGEVHNIDEFLEGKFVQSNDKLDLVLRYERDYDTPSWQKAGKLTIKEID